MLPRSGLRLAASKSNSSTRLPRTTTTRVSSGWVASMSILLAIELSYAAPAPSTSAGTPDGGSRASKGGPKTGRGRKRNKEATPQSRGADAAGSTRPGEHGCGAHTRWPSGPHLPADASSCAAVHSSIEQGKPRSGPIRLKAHGGWARGYARESATIRRPGPGNDVGDGGTWRAEQVPLVSITRPRRGPIMIGDGQSVRSAPRHRTA